MKKLLILCLAFANTLTSDDTQPINDIHSITEDSSIQTSNELLDSNSKELLAPKNFTPPLSITKDLEKDPTVLTKPFKSPSAATFLSIIPGLGHVYLGQYSTAATIFGAYASSIIIAADSKDIKLSTLSGATAQNTAFYSFYAAYRDARINNGSISSIHPMPTDSFTDLATGIFSPSILGKPEVWGGYLGAFGGAIAIGYLSEKYSTAAIEDDRPTLDFLNGITPMVAFPVGIGEEALFRGFLQPALMQYFTPTTSIIISSLAFGAVHIPNAIGMSPAHQINYYTFSIPYITSLGAYMGWMAYKNNSLRESVALHTWYDFTIFAIAYGASKATKTPPARTYQFSIPLTF